jgi:hypothetical protein
MITALNNKMNIQSNYQYNIVCKRHEKRGNRYLNMAAKMEE